MRRRAELDQSWIGRTNRELGLWAAIAIAAFGVLTLVHPVAPAGWPLIALGEITALSAFALAGRRERWAATAIVAGAVATSIGTVLTVGRPNGAWIGGLAIALAIAGLTLPLRGVLVTLAIALAAPLFAWWWTSDSPGAAVSPVHLVAAQIILVSIAAGLARAASHHLRVARQEAERRTREFRRVVDHSPYGIVAFGPGLDVERTNRRMAEVVGESNAETRVGEAALWREPTMRDVLQRALAGERIAAEMSFEPGGETRVLRVWAAPRHGPDGAIGGVQCLVADVSRAAKLRQRLLHAQKLESVATLVGGVSHEFNNLLTVILGQTERLLDQLPGEGIDHDAAEAIQSAAQRSAELTRQLMLFGQHENAPVETIDLLEVARSMAPALVRMAGPRIAQTLVTGDVPLPVRVNRALLEQSLANLVLNARDAMPRGGAIAIETLPVEVRSSEHTALHAGSYARIVVRDSGVGIAPGLLERVFEPFFTTKGPGEGTGLGLATVHGIARRAGGAASVESQPGRGARFVIDLPLSDARLADETGSDPAPELRHAGGEQLLLVEDDLLVRDLAAGILEEAGYRVIATASAAEAIDAAKALGPLDLLVTNVVLPLHSGSELTRRLRAQTPRLRVLFTSGFGSVAASSGGEGFLAKPFTSRELLKAVRAALD